MFRKIVVFNIILRWPGSLCPKQVPNVRLRQQMAICYGGCASRIALTSLSKLGGLVTICCPLFYTTKVLYYSYNTIIISIIIFIKASSWIKYHICTSVQLTAYLYILFYTKFIHENNLVVYLSVCHFESGLV